MMLHAAAQRVTPVIASKGMSRWPLVAGGQSSLSQE